MMTAWGGVFAVTFRIASSLVTCPYAFEMTTRKRATSSARVGAASVYVRAVAPGMGPPSRSHWYESGAVPDAVTAKVAGVPTLTVRLAGCTVMVGAWLVV